MARNDQRLLLARSTILEDRVAIQHREIQSLLLENQRLTCAQVALKRNLALAKDDLRRLSSTAAAVKAERDDQVREVYERSLKLDAEVRAIDAMALELVQVRADVQRLTVHREELEAQLMDVNSELANTRGESREVMVVKKEIETMQREIQRGRAAIELEEKAKASNLEQGQIMEKNLVALTHEIERLQAELATAEKRARAAAAAANPNLGYDEGYNNPEVSCGGGPGLFSLSYSMQVHDLTAAPCVSEEMPNRLSEVQVQVPQTHVRR